MSLASYTIIFCLWLPVLVTSASASNTTYGNYESEYSDNTSTDYGNSTTTHGTDNDYDIEIDHYDYDETVVTTNETTEIDDYDETTSGSGSGNGYGFITDDSDYYGTNGGETGDDDTGIVQEHFCDQALFLPFFKVCDGHVDCNDCSDEINCATASSIFMCHAIDRNVAITSFTRERNASYSSSNPRCINMNRFCDGIQDCSTNDDERKDDVGFKCPIKGRHWSCVLPPAMVCDGTMHCEDGSDLCTAEYEDNKPRLSQSSKVGFFQCLSNENEKIFQKQLCDGVFDCADLSDECLCEKYDSKIVQEICPRLCTSALIPNCAECAFGKYHWESEDNTTCVNSIEILKLVQTDIKNTFVWRPNGSDNKPYHRSVIDCFDQTLTHVARATKCDGRPECFFGEDECGVGCPDEAEFCNFLVVDYGYVCQNGTTNTADDPVVLCDGKIQCDDASDEKFCTKQFKCDETEWVDSNVVCDGFVHCSSGADEANCPNTQYFTCQEGNFSEHVHVSKMLDGYSDCANGLDECPMYFHHTNGSSSGVSNSNMAIKSMSLQVFMVVMSIVGICLMLMTISVTILRLYQNCTSRSDNGTDKQLIITQESYLHISVIMCKMLMCLLFLAWKIKRWENASYCSRDLQWRSSTHCTLLGAICFVIIQVPIYAVSLHAFISMIAHIGSMNQRKIKNSCFLFVAIVVLLAVTWLPVSYISWLLATPNEFSEKLISYGWIKSTGLPDESRSNLYSYEDGRRLTLQVMALSSSTGVHINSSTDQFSFHGMAEVINSVLPNTNMEVLGTFGYFGQSTLCFPNFLLGSNQGEVGETMNVPNAEIQNVNLVVFIIIAISVLFSIIASITHLILTQKRHQDNPEFLKSAALQLYLCINESLMWFVIFIIKLLLFLQPSLESHISVLLSITLTFILINSISVCPILLLGKSCSNKPTKKHRTKYLKSNNNKAALKVEETRPLNGASNV